MITNHTRHAWTASENAVLLARYPNEPTRVVAAALGLTVGRVHQQAYRLGLRKTEAYLASPAAGRTDGSRGKHNRFAPGHVTWNKGMKGLQIGGHATRFKPGQKPHTTLPVGSYRLDGDGYLQQKIGEATGSNSKRWRGVQHVAQGAVAEHLQRSTDPLAGIPDAATRPYVRRVVCAANFHKNSGSIFLGARHGDELMRDKVNNWCWRSGRIFPSDDDRTQGFIDQHGIFMTRTEAWQVALAAGQIRYRCGGDDANGGTLYSENLY